jgi:membrane-bound lytic murein transglycosylase B
LKRPKKHTTVLAAIATTGAAAALGLTLAGAPAQAEPSPSTSAPASAAPDGADGRAQRQDELAAALATELGIDKAKVAAALEKIQAARKADGKAPAQDGTRPDRTAELKTRLDAAVTAGTLTAAESAAILKAAEAGILLHGGPGGGGHGMAGGPGR